MPVGGQEKIEVKIPKWVAVAFAVVAVPAAFVWSEDAEKTRAREGFQVLQQSNRPQDQLAVEFIQKANQQHACHVLHHRYRTLCDHMEPHI